MREMRLEHHSVPRRAALAHGRRPAEMPRRPPLPPSRSQLRTSGRTSRKGAAAAHCIRRLRCSRVPRVAQFQTAEATLLDQPVLVHGGDDSPPSIRFLFLSSHRKWHCRLFQWEWRAERSRRRPVPVLHVSEATSKFCNVTKQNVAGKRKFRYRFNLRACNSYAQVEQRVGTA